MGLDCRRGRGEFENAADALLSLKLKELEKPLIVDTAAGIEHQLHLLLTLESLGYFVGHPLGEALPKDRLSFGVVLMVFGMPNVSVFVSAHGEHPVFGHVVQKMNGGGRHGFAIVAGNQHDGGDPQDLTARKTGVVATVLGGFGQTVDVHQKDFFDGSLDL